MLNKKAMAQSTLVAIIAAILSFIVVSFWLFPAVAGSQGKQAEKVCQASVSLRAATALNAGPVEYKSGPLLCKTLSPKIKGDKKDVQKKLEEKIKTCWNTFGAGTYDENVFAKLNIFGGGKSCFTCSVPVIESTRKFKEGEDSITSEEFMQSLRDSGTINYIQTGQGKGSFVALLEENKGIQPNGAYAISYKAGTGTCTWCGVIGGSAVATAGAIFTGTALFLFPEPATTVAGAVILAKAVATIGIGAAVTGVGAGVAAGSATNIYVHNILDEAAIDTIIFTDITNPAMSNLLKEKCNFVEGVDD